MLLFWVGVVRKVGLRAGSTGKSNTGGKKAGKVTTDETERKDDAHKTMD